MNVGAQRRARTETARAYKRRMVDEWARQYAAMKERDCPEGDGVHDPDWRTASVSYDGDETYIDINCKNCGRSGCVGTAKTLEAEIDW